jgi:hypothetical protein
MNDIVSFRTRTLLVQSLRAVEAGKERIALALSTSLARSERDPELSDTPDIIAALLLNFLIEQVEHVTETGEPGELDRHRAEHRLHGIDGRHYSRFGDVLVPVLRDTLGPSHPRATALAWSDAFWAVVQRMRQGGEPDAATKAPRMADAMA